MLPASAIQKVRGRPGDGIRSVRSRTRRQEQKTRHTSAQRRPPPPSHSTTCSHKTPWNDNSRTTILRAAYRKVNGLGPPEHAWALISGDFFDNLRIMFLLFGGLLILLAGAGNRASMTNQTLSWGVLSGIRGYGYWSPAFAPRPGEPTLTSSAGSVSSGAVLLLLGMI